MKISDFQSSFSSSLPPPGLSLALQALWHDGKGDWQRAHECAQEQEDSDGAWVHAYLHRKEGDLPNSRYWYSQAGRQFFPGDLDEEWRLILTSLLSSSS